MATAREIRRRMRSVDNTRQITRAMELVAVTRMRRAQQRVEATRPYASKMRELLMHLVARVERDEEQVPHSLLEARPVQREAMIVITTDRGLCGALNSNVLRAALQRIVAAPREGRSLDVIAVGRKGPQMMRRVAVRYIAQFSDLGDRPRLVDTLPIARIAIDGFSNHQFDAVQVLYPRFVSTTRQEPTFLPVLPMAPGKEESGAAERIDYIYEPDQRLVLAALLPRYVEIQIYQAILETIASEYSARMVAMHNATENAGELYQSLRMSLNKARQASITREIIEVASGAQALAAAS